MATVDSVPDLLPSDDIDPASREDVSRLAEITGCPIPDDLTPAQTVVAVFRAAQKEMTRRRVSHKSLVIELREDTLALMTQDTPEGHEARRLCWDICRSGWMVGVMPVDYTIRPNEAYPQLDAEG